MGTVWVCANMRKSGESVSTTGSFESGSGPARRRTERSALREGEPRPGPATPHRATVQVRTRTRTRTTG
eukprot:542596-Rhodomonas_salina.3